MLGENSLSGDSSPGDSSSESDVYDDGYLRIEHNRFYLTCAGKPLYHLTRKEFLILSRLGRGAGRPVTKEEVWNHAWGKGAAYNYNTLRVHVASLRRKLSSFELDIVAVVHVGYRLVRSAGVKEGEVHPTHT